MSNHQLIQGSVFGTLLIVAVGCGSSADAGASGAGGVGAASGGDSAAGGSGTNAGTTGIVATTSSTNGGGAATGGLGNTLGGNTATGGTSVVAATGVLGQQCSPAGTLGCNGINQKLTLVCGGNGTWQTNQTCNSATQVCDPRPGSTQGTCQEQDGLCATTTPGQQFCSNYAEWKCDAWGMKATKVRDCDIGPCANDKCFDETGCLTTANFLSCSSDCTSKLDASIFCTPYRADASTATTDGVNGSAVVRISYPDSAPIDAPIRGKCLSRRYYTITGMGYPDAYLRVQVQAPWGVNTLEDMPSCSSTLDSCLVMGPNEHYFGVLTDDANAPPANIFIEATAVEPPACPGST